jgi:hypothetical protein
MAASGTLIPDDQVVRVVEGDLDRGLLGAPVEIRVPARSSTLLAELTPAR